MRLRSNGAYLFDAPQSCRAKKVIVNELVFEASHAVWTVNRMPTEREREAFLTGLDRDNRHWEWVPGSDVEELRFNSL